MHKRKVKIVNKSKNELPFYATEFSAGFDLKSDFSRIKDGKFLGDSETFSYNSENNTVTLQGNGGRILIPTGIFVAIPDGHEIQIRPRSGLAINHGISVLNTPGTIDCFSEDSFIKTINGDKKINELNINDVVLSVNDKMEIEKDTIVAIVNTGNQEVYKIETEDGIIELTANTDIYTKYGLKKVKDLTENDEIIIF